MNRPQLKKSQETTRGSSYTYSNSKVLEKEQRLPLLAWQRLNQGRDCHNSANEKPLFSELLIPPGDSLFPIALPTSFSHL